MRATEIEEEEEEEEEDAYNINVWILNNIYED
jgi:hypothetical protein